MAQVHFTGVVVGASDPVVVPLALFQIVFSGVVSLTLWRLTAWQRRYDGLEGRLNEAAGRLVDERFRSVTAEVQSHVRGMLLSLEEIRQQIRTADTQFRAMNDRDQKIELTLAGKIDLLKDYIRDLTASKADLERHESAVDRRLAQIEQRLMVRSGEGGGSWERGAGS